MRNYLSIDIGGTNLKYGLIDHSGKLVEHDQVSTPTEKDEFFKAFNGIVRKYHQDIFGVAVSVPGKVDSTSGTVYFGGSLPFLHGINFKELIQSEFGPLPVGVENDGKAAALAEQWLGVLKDIPNAAAVILGTGVGGGIIVNHQLLSGSHFQAGELSFMVNDYRASNDDRLVGLNTSAVEMIKKIATVLELPDLKDGKAVFEKISQGNEQAVTIFKAYCRRVALLILNVQSVVDLTTYAIGGGISSQPLVITTINEEYDKMVAEMPLIQQMLTRPEIKKAQFENSANLYGALYGLLQRLDDQQYKEEK